MQGILSRLGPNCSKHSFSRRRRRRRQQQHTAMGMENNECVDICEVYVWSFISIFVSGITRLIEHFPGLQLYKSGHYASFVVALGIGKSHDR